MPKLLEWFLLFLATMASSDAEDRRLAKDGGEVRTQTVYAYYTQTDPSPTSRKRRGALPLPPRPRANDLLVNFDVFRDIHDMLDGRARVYTFAKFRAEVRP